MNKEKQIEFERNDISDIIAHTFEPCGKQYDASDFEWSAHCLQMSGYHKQEWISVEERLPTWEDGKVLVFTKYGFSICERTVNSRWQGKHANWITHWMPLPEPPKGE